MFYLLIQASLIPTKQAAIIDQNNLSGKITTVFNLWPKFIWGIIERQKFSDEVLIPNNIAMVGLLTATTHEHKLWMSMTLGCCW